MHVLDREQFYDEVRSYLREQSGARSSTEVSRAGATDNLWDAGYLDSFGMVALLSFLEDLLGREIVLTADSLRTFHTLERIYDNYVAQPPNQAPV